MHHHRFRDLVTPPLPAQQAAPLSSPGFMACPVVLLAGQAGAPCAWQQLIYQLALQQAQSKPRFTLPNYDFAAAWN
jgi:hypothetical protein